MQFFMDPFVFVITNLFPDFIIRVVFENIFYFGIFFKKLYGEKPW